MALLWRKKKKEPHQCPHRAQQSITAATGKDPAGDINNSSNHVSEAVVDRNKDEHLIVSSEVSDRNQPCQICRTEQLAARRYRIKLIIGLFFPFALQALDVTIVASALPWIASDFRKDAILRMDRDADIR